MELAAEPKSQMNGTDGVGVLETKMAVRQEASSHAAALW